MLNGIPCIGTNHSGVTEAIGKAGILVDLPEYCHQPPFTRLPPISHLKELAATIEQAYDSRDQYRALRTEALSNAEDYDLRERAFNLDRLLNDTISLRAGYS
jgi:glycosyltransferase involved in cell wall biosynthesis